MTGARRQSARPDVTALDIAEAVAAKRRPVTVSAIMGRRKHASVTDARTLAYCAASWLGWTQTRIAAEFHRDGQTVKRMLRRAREQERYRETIVRDVALKARARARRRIEAEEAVDAPEEPERGARPHAIRQARVPSRLEADREAWARRPSIVRAPDPAALRAGNARRARV